MNFIRASFVFAFLTTLCAAQAFHCNLDENKSIAGVSVDLRYATPDNFENPRSPPRKAERTRTGMSPAGSLFRL